MIREITFEEFEIGCKVADELCKIEDATMFASILGLAIDQWTVATNRTYEEAHELLANLLEVHELVNAELGRMKI